MKIHAIEKQGNSGFDLQRLRFVRNLLRWQGFPYVFQVIALFIFLALTIIGWKLYTPAGINDKLFAKSNLVNLTIWGLWWPLMIWMAVLFGRVWCSVCPMELVSNVGERISQWLGIRQLRLSKPLRSGILIVAFYALIQLLVAGVHLH